MPIVPTFEDPGPKYLCAAIIPRLNQVGASFAAPLQAPGNYKTPEAIQKYLQEKEATRLDDLAKTPITAQVQEIAIVDELGNPVKDGESNGTDLIRPLTVLSNHLEYGGLIFGLGLKNLLAILCMDVFRPDALYDYRGLMHRELWGHKGIIDPMLWLLPNAEARKTIPFLSLLKYYGVAGVGDSALGLAKTVQKLVQASGLEYVGGLDEQPND